MSSSSEVEGTLASPTEQQAADALIATAMDAKLMVATGSGDDVQQLKDLVNKQDQDSKIMVVVMAKQKAASYVEKPHPLQGNMDPHLLALASSGSSEELKSLLCRDDSQVVFGSGMDGNGSLIIQQQANDNTAAEERHACTDVVEEVAAEADSEASAVGVEGSLPTRKASGDIVEANELILEVEGITITAEEGQARANVVGTDGSLPIRRACDDIEANELILEGVTAQGDTALHVVAACSGQGDKHLLQQNSKWWRCLTRDESQALLTTYGYGDGDNFLESARIIYGKAKHLLFVQNNNGDTPLHCAARAGKSNMVACLIDLAFTEGDNRMKELLRKENKHKETALHGAVRVGNKDIVDLLMEKDSELASFPEDGGASPMYLAIMLNQGLLQHTLYRKSNGNLSFAGPNGQNVLHATILRHNDISELLEWNETHRCLQNMKLTTQRDENGRTPLHFAAAIIKPSSICQQVLEANPDVLYQPDHAGFFPIHVAASVGAFRNVDLFVTKYPGSASLCSAKGRTFLHVAVVENKLDIIEYACRNLSLSWIMNMVDNDGNTALHLAVDVGTFGMFCSLLRNPQVNLNLPNNRGETPLDIVIDANNVIPERVLFLDSQMKRDGSLQMHMHLALTYVGAVMGVCRQDHYKHSITPRAFDQKKEMDVVKESSGALCIGSVLIATVTFGVTFAVPGGYIADDDHNNEGSPVLARKYAFQGFIWSNTSAFVLSTIATVALMKSGSPVFNLGRRKTNLGIGSYFVSISITCLAAAFAFAAYVVLAPVAYETAIGVCCLTSVALLLNHLAEISTISLLLKPLRTRMGLIRACVVSARAIMGVMASQFWPLIIIFGMAASAYLMSPKIEAPAPAPAPLAST